MKKPIFSGNPVDELLQKQGYIQPEGQAATVPARSEQTEPQARPKANQVQLIQLFGDYGIPYKMGTSKKDRRAQLLLYPEEQKKAAEVASALGISFNELAAAAINKICRDYEEQEKR